MVGTRRLWGTFSGSWASMGTAMRHSTPLDSPCYTSAAPGPRPEPRQSPVHARSAYCTGVRRNTPGVSALASTHHTERASSSTRAPIDVLSSPPVIQQHFFGSIKRLHAVLLEIPAEAGARPPRNERTNALNQQQTLH